MFPTTAVCFSGTGTCLGWFAHVAIKAPQPGTSGSGDVAFVSVAFAMIQSSSPGCRSSCRAFLFDSGKAKKRSFTLATLSPRTAFAGFFERPSSEIRCLPRCVVAPSFANFFKSIVFAASSSLSVRASDFGAGIRLSVLLSALLSRSVTSFICFSSTICSGVACGATSFTDFSSVLPTTADAGRSATGVALPPKPPPPCWLDWPTCFEPDCG